MRCYRAAAIFALFSCSHAADSSALFPTYLLDNGEPNFAYLEYRRQTIENPDQACDLCLAGATALRQLRKPGRAIRMLEQHLHDCANDSSFHAKARLALIRMHLAEGNYVSAKYVLDGWTKKISPRDFEIQYLLAAMIEGHLGNYAGAETSLAAVGEKYSVQKRSVLQLLDEAKKQKTRNPERARLLSTLIPGLGSVYAGKKIPGVVGFLTTAGLSVGAGYSGYNFFHSTNRERRLITGMDCLVLGFLVFRSASNGRKAALMTALEHNRQVMFRFHTRLNKICETVAYE